MKDDNILIGLLSEMEIINLKIQQEQKSTESGLDKRALSIAITQLETSMLWVANSRP